MNSNIKKRKSLDGSTLLSVLWLFATLNYMFCDVFGFMDSNMLNQYVTGVVNGMKLTGNFILGGAILMEIPMFMIVLCRVLPYKSNRIVNIIAGLVMTIVQTSSLFAGSPKVYYIFCSIIEIGCTAFITLYAIKWFKPNNAA